MNAPKYVNHTLWGLTLNTSFTLSTFLIHKIILQTNHSQVYSGCHTIRLEVAMQWVGTRPGRVGPRSTIHNVRRGCCRWSDMPEVNGPLVVPRVHDIVHGHENLVHKQSLALSQTVISCVVIVATPGPASCFCTNLLMLLWLTNGEASCPPHLHVRIGVLLFVERRTTLIHTTGLHIQLYRTVWTFPSRKYTKRPLLPWQLVSYLHLINPLAPITFLSFLLSTSL